MTDRSRNFEVAVSGLAEHLERSRHHLVGDILRKGARTRPAATAVVDTDGATVSYRTLNDRVNALANALLDRGIDHGSRLAVLSENRAAVIEALYAGSKIGALVPLLNWRQESEELRHCLEIVDADAIVVSGNKPEKYRLLRESGFDGDVIALDGRDWGPSYESLIEDAPSSEPEPSRPPAAEDGVAIFYTSGTTGLPKGAVVSHRALYHRAISWELIADTGPDYLAWPPMFHMGSIERTLTVHMLGGTLYALEGFEAESVLERVVDSRSSYVTLVPSVIDPILETAEAEGYGPDDFGHVDLVGALADLVSAAKLQQVTELFDADYLNTFGTTETGLTPLTGNVIPAGTYPTADDLSKVEGPIGTVTLVDEDWNRVPDGEAGELAFRGPTLFSGYIGDPDANDTDFREGWFRTGDVFVHNEDGTYDFVDRKQYLIKSGGENIYPAEIERLLMDQPEIEEALLVRVPDERWGEVPKAYIALEDGYDLSRSAVLDRLSGTVSRYKLPHYVEFVDAESFPRSTTGKIVRTEVEAWSVDPDERVRDP